MTAAAGTAFASTTSYHYDALGRQDITMYGIDPRTHAGRVLVEADYRMKLVGIGLETPRAGGGRLSSVA